MEEKTTMLDIEGLPNKSIFEKGAKNES